MRERTTYLTTDEYNFIKKLGSFSKSKLSRLELLSNYLASIELRGNWIDDNIGLDINKDSIIILTKDEIEKEGING